MDALYSAKHCKIVFDESTDYLQIKWSGFPKSEGFREACTKLIVMMKELVIKKLLTDNSKAAVFAVSDQKWLNNTWLPEAEKVGYYCSAVVCNNDIFINAAIRNITNKRDSSKFIHKQFEDLNSAKNWLNTV